MKKYEFLGSMQGYSDIELIKKNNEFYALGGWNGEKFTKCWQVTELGHSVNNNEFEMLPIYNIDLENEQEYMEFIENNEIEIIDYIRKDC